MKHEEAWKRLPDLLDDRDDADLLVHVRACPDCQRQLFLLGRVDRMLRTSAAEVGAAEKRRPSLRRLLVAAGAAAAAAAATVTLFFAHQGGKDELMLRTASGRPVGHAVIRRSDARNVSLALVARSLPVEGGHVFVLWAGDDERSVMQVGRFMVDRSGGCRVRFNLPATHSWRRFWVTVPGKAATVVAST